MIIFYIPPSSFFGNTTSQAVLFCEFLCQCTIGNQYNGTSALSFYDIQTGYYVEKFNFNLIQYGYPAQLCLEVSGSLADSAYFGIIVDEFKMCKIGVTIDSRFIKPTSIATTVIDFTQQISIGGGDLG